jgi:hypothetical protein
VGGVAAQLVGPAQDDFSAAVIALDLAFNLDLPSLELSNISHLFQISGKHHDHKRAHAIIFAKIKKMHALGALLHAHYFARHAAHRANVVAGLGDGDARSRSRVTTAEKYCEETDKPAHGGMTRISLRREFTAEGIFAE